MSKESALSRLGYCGAFTLWAALVLVASVGNRATATNNVLLICIDDLRPELNCFGRDYIVSPHIDDLAQQGVLFKRHYVQAPTCGASRYALLTGNYGGASNGAIFERAKRIAAGQ
ncbi:MAG TPA: hypothetical protein DDW52_03635, partial [Planctomycetaceae bacterium]|nr:hypothetical protein [Planctomycetaceae bacterium]